MAGKKKSRQQKKDRCGCKLCIPTVIWRRAKDWTEVEVHRTERQTPQRNGKINRQSSKGARVNWGLQIVHRVAPVYWVLMPLLCESASIYPNRDHSPVWSEFRSIMTAIISSNRFLWPQKWTLMWMQMDELNSTWSSKWIEFIYMKSCLPHTTSWP